MFYARDGYRVNGCGSPDSYRKLTMNTTKASITNALLLFNADKLTGEELCLVIVEYLTEKVELIHDPNEVVIYLKTIKSLLKSVQHIQG